MRRWVIWVCCHVVGLGYATAAEQSGEASFAKYCGACHSENDVAGALKTNPQNRELAKTHLLTFLESHGEADAAAARDIVEYLSREANK